jgi:hypothetical protein
VNDDLTPEEQAELEAYENELTPEEQAELDSYEAAGVPWTEPAQRVRGVLGGLVEGVGAASEFVDKYTYAPIRAAIGANQRMKDPVEAFAAQFGESPEYAPAAKDIAGMAGFSKEPTIPTGLRKMNGDQFKLSPAGLAGGVGGTLADPLTYAGGIFEAAPAMVSRFAPKLGAALETRAASQAVKAATGGDVGSLRSALKTKRFGSKDPAVLAAREKRIGLDMLETDEAGGPVIKFGSRAEDIAPRLADKSEFYGTAIGKYDDAIDDAIPTGAFNSAGLADDLLAMAADVTPIGGGSAAQERLLQIAQDFQDHGPLTLGRARQLKKDMFPFNPASTDPAISNRSLNNSINQMIEHHIEATIDDWIGNADFPPYGLAKSKYSSYTPMAQASTEKVIKGKVNRSMSPTDYMATIGGGATMGAATQDPIVGLVSAVAAGAANHVLRGRGNAAMAKSLHMLSKAATAGGKLAGSRFMQRLGQAAMRGNQALLGTHHLLMNNDDEYRDIIEQSNAEGEP